MRALKKSDIETLLQHYDNNPAEALLTCLRILLEDSQVTWSQAIQRLDDNWNREGLLRVDIAACDQLVKHLVEFRSLEKI
ncbi:MAG: hypothetical protein RIR69_1583 [Actinomycetota bacterium]